MIIRALLPKLTPRTVKEKIIFLLASEFPLTVKELRMKIKHNFQESVSYQSVHKELNRLMDEEIVSCQEKKYLLNTEWIKQVGLFSDLILSSYTRQKKHSINKLLDLRHDGDSLSFDFESYAELDRYFMELLDYFNEFFDKDQAILMHYTHNWWPLVYPLQEKLVVSKLQSPMYCVCGSDSPIDKFCSDFEKNIGIQIHHSKDKSLHWNLNVMGDLIFSFYGDNEINQEIGNYFAKHKELKSLDVKKLIDLLEKKGRFRVVVLKDSVYARNALEEIKLFN
jgi:hypothetical protein